MIFRQLFEPLSSTYTYLLGCEETGQAILIDPVIVSMERDLAEIAKLGMKLAYTVDTHIHADHVSGGPALAERLGVPYSVFAGEGFDLRQPVAPLADLPTAIDEQRQVGIVSLGHKESSLSGRRISCRAAP